MTYDVKCYELAKAFLGDEPEFATDENVDRLASVLQATIEDFLLDLRLPEVPLEGYNQ